MKFILIAGVLLVLHAPDGEEVQVASEHVTTLTMRREVIKEKKLFPESAQCLVSLDDSKFVAVRETCREIKTMMEQAR